MLLPLLLFGVNNPFLCRGLHRKNETDNKADSNVLSLVLSAADSCLGFKVCHVFAV